MNRNSGFALNTSSTASFFRIVVEVLMHAAGLDDHDVAGLPVDPPAVMDVMAAALQHEEHRAVQMPVFLAERSRPIGLDMRFDRLRRPLSCPA